MRLKNPDYETVIKFADKIDSVEVEKSNDAIKNQDLIKTMIEKGFSLKNTNSGFHFKRARK